MNNNESPKYNRTKHVPWSEGASSDDKIADSVDSLLGIPIVITEKIDGSNTCLERHSCFARTHSCLPKHESFNEFKVLHACLKWAIPESHQLFGEWCYAKHSIEYSALPGYFLLFNVRVLYPDAFWMSWSDVEAVAKELALPTVPILFSGSVKSEPELRELVNSFMQQSSCCGGQREGVVIRNAERFSDNNSAFSDNVMKYVRAGHVQTDEHWMNLPMIKNKLVRK